MENRKRQLIEPKSQETAAYCNLGRTPYTKDGVKLWGMENTKDLSQYQTIDSEQRWDYGIAISSQVHPPASPMSSTKI